MKKSTKILIVIAVVMVVLGFILCIGGAVTGGMGGIKYADFFVDTREFVEEIQDDSFGFHHGKDEMTYSANEINSMDFEIGAAELDVKVSDSEDTISVDIERGNFDVYVKNRELHIEGKKHHKDSKMTIWIPKDYQFQEVEFSIGASDVYIEKIKTDFFEVELGAAKLEIDSLEAKKISMSVGMGSAEITMADADMEDYNYEIECGAGNIILGDESFGGVATERKINNHAKAEMELECGMGEIIINF